MLHIGQEVFIVYGDKLLVKKIISLYINKDVVEGSLGWLDYNERNTPFAFSRGKVILNYTYAYNRSESALGFLTKKDAAASRRNQILKINQELRDKVSKAMNDLKTFREKHHEVLWSTDTDKWIENFEREYAW